LKKYHILIIPAWFNHKNKFDGIFIHQFCDALQRNGQEVSLLYVKVFSISQIFNYFKRLTFDFEVNFNIITIKKINFFSPKLFKNGINLFKESLLKKVLKKIKTKDIDIIHFQSLCNNLTPYLGYEISKGNAIPYVITEHYTSYEEAGELIFNPYINGKTVQNIFINSQKNIAVSEFAAKKFAEYFHTEFTAIPNIMAKSFFSLPFKEIKNDKTFKFIFIGGLTQRKGIMELLAAYKSIFVSEAKTELTLIGEGELKNSVDNFIKENKLNENVKLLGKKTEEEIIEQLDLHHCLISASETETFGLVIVESFLRGRPVIAINSGAVEELVNLNNGILCDAEPKEENLILSIKQMIKNYSSFNQFEIRKKAIERYSETGIVGQYLNIYEKAIVKN
jgi:glycosyltransferase involved in cell wall biosynthesis